MLNNFDLLYSMFNPFVYQEAKNNIEDLEYYFQTNPNTMANPLVEELVGAIKKYDYDSIGEPLFQSIFAKCRKNPAESGKIMSEISKWAGFSKEQIKPSIKYLQDICASVIIQKANRKFQDEPSQFLKYIKDYNIKTSDPNVFKSVKFNEIDLNSILEDNSKGAVSTNIEWLNKAFEPHNGLERGQLGIICAPPGVGKSLLSMNLALWMASNGEKVVYYCLGDMNMKDFIIRMGAIAFGISFADAYRNLPTVYLNLTKMVGENLEISINPAGVVTAQEMVDMTLNGNFTVAVVDYDGNIAGAQEGESMYNSFGLIYNTLTQLSLSGILTLVCAQPKITAWERQIEMSDIGESSKKQHAADFIITISDLNRNCPNHLYTMKLPKARRGKVGTMAYVIRIDGRFKEIPRELYEELKMVDIPKAYTEKEIDDMIQRTMVNRGQINNQGAGTLYGSLMSQKQSTSMPKKTLKNPFTNP